MNRVNILSHHKCATSWLRVYLEEFCSINSIPLSASHLSHIFNDNPNGIDILTNSSYDFIKDKMDDGIHIIRNPLDIIVSAYHSHKKTHSVDGWPELARQREIINEVSEEEGYYLTLAFLERDDFYNGAVGPLHGLRHWNYDDHRFLTIKMEDLVKNPNGIIESYLKEKLQFNHSVRSEKYTFSSFSGRTIGNIDESSHYRSGKENQYIGTLPAGVIKYIRCHYKTILEKFYPYSLLN
ncbi:hypothetical protein Dd703_3578 [Musicola paradisiaca Ech703]|uniref:Sulfotransferase domain-containing protein n=2 Tax=Musicola paradisiaca TaxID=69223 RepID=C6C409_MUSP7|nr:hypothetical protein Dd703_3578 [Musicola paradisiaca Ech703]